MPPRARWHESWIDEQGSEVPPLKHLKHDIGNMLNKAIAAIEDENDALAEVLKNNIDFNAIKGKIKIADQKWKDLLDHFNQPNFVLVNDNFEFPDLLGDSNGTVWSICNMHMILHNITCFTIENGDTLENPQILENDQPRKFDCVLANPPFSQNYSRASMIFPSRFREFCPETGKKADLMFVQHIIASLKPDGHTACCFAANLRRSSWKLRFDWLKPGQCWGLFVQEFARLCGEIAQAVAWKEPVLRLDRLAPGDVAAVVRQYELWDEPPARENSIVAWPPRWPPSGRKQGPNRWRPHDPPAEKCNRVRVKTDGLVGQTHKRRAPDGRAPSCDDYCRTEIRR